MGLSGGCISLTPHGPWRSLLKLHDKGAVAQGRKKITIPSSSFLIAILAIPSPASSLIPPCVISRTPTPHTMNNIPGMGAPVGAAGRTYDQNDPNIKAVCSLRLELHTQRLLTQIPDECDDGIMLRKVRVIWRHGLRYGRSFRNLHGFCMCAPLPFTRFPWRSPRNLLGACNSSSLESHFPCLRLSPLA
jgi:hypothetical protein